MIISETNIFHSNNKIQIYFISLLAHCIDKCEEQINVILKLWRNPHHHRVDDFGSQWDFKDPKGITGEQLFCIATCFLLRRSKTEPHSPSDDDYDVILVRSQIVDSAEVAVQEVLVLPLLWKLYYFNIFQLNISVKRFSYRNQQWPT